MKNVAGWLLLGCMLVSCAEERSVRFSFKYSPGETYLYRIYDDVETKRSSAYDEKDDFTAFVHQEQASRIKVLTIDDDGRYHLYVDFEIEVDTLWFPEGQAPSEQQERRNAVGKRYVYYLTMREDGEIMCVEGKDNSSTFFYERAYKTSQPVFPQEALSPGYTWRQKVSVRMPGADPFTAITTYTFDRFERLRDRDCAVIRFDSSLEIETDLTKTKYNKKPMHKKWNYSNVTRSQGDIYFDYQRGILLQKESVISMERKSSIVDKEGFAREISRVTTDKERIELVSVQQDSLSRTQY